MKPEHYFVCCPDTRFKFRTNSNSKLVLIGALPLLHWNRRFFPPAGLCLHLDLNLHTEKMSQSWKTLCALFLGLYIFDPVPAHITVSSKCSSSTISILLHENRAKSWSEQVLSPTSTNSFWENGECKVGSDIHIFSSNNCFSRRLSDWNSMCRILIRGMWCL